MEVLYFLEKIRFPLLNEFMLLITQMGEETVFLVVALIYFWCVNKRYGYYILSVGFLGTITNQFLKLICRVPRPWVLDPEFTILEQAREAATGYSFPSGHTQSAVGTFGCMARITNRKAIRIVAIMVAVLVPISRMYIGVHTPKDVIVAAATAVLLIIIMHPIVIDHAEKCMPILLGVMTICAIVFLCFVEFYRFPANVDAGNLASGVKNAYTLLGALMGLLIVYFVDGKWIQFSTEAVWWAQILKVLLGLVLVLAVKSGMKTPLNWLLGESIGRAARYFLIVILAGAVWPLSFKWFSELGRKQ